MTCKPLIAAALTAVLFVPAIASAKKLSVAIEGLPGPQTPVDATHVALHPTADGHATHMGNVHFEADEIADFGQIGIGIVSTSSTFTLTAANGDQVFGTIHTTGFAFGPTAEFEGPYVITGGTGRFEGATGEGSWNVFFPSTVPGNTVPAQVSGNGTIFY